jgi:hypothetical protein
VLDDGEDRLGSPTLELFSSPHLTAHPRPSHLLLHVLLLALRTSSPNSNNTPNPHTTPQAIHHRHHPVYHPDNIRLAAALAGIAYPAAAVRIPVPAAVRIGLEEVPRIGLLAVRSLAAAAARTDLETRRSSPSCRLAARESRCCSRVGRRRALGVGRLGRRGVRRREGRIFETLL